MGVWIEMYTGTSPMLAYCVTPFMGVWIEINISIVDDLIQPVTPFMGVWIEIFYKRIVKGVSKGHSLHGSVD